jgi:hypothetical protein
MSMNLNRISAWEDKFLSGNHSEDDWFLEQLRTETKSFNFPLLFRTASQIETFAFLKANGFDLTQRDKNGSTLLMETHVPFDLPTYRWLADQFHDGYAIDLADNEGLTALSATIKRGQIEKARILLEHGASIHSFATVARYGNSKLDIPTQALNCHPSNDSDPQDAPIEALSLLREFGFKPDEDQVSRMLETIGDRRPKLKQWILTSWPTQAKADG